jgi:hypothetical protein
VTEFRWKAQDTQNGSSFTIEVEHLSTEEIEKMLPELLRDFQQIYLPSSEDYPESSEEYQHWMRQSNVAWDTLKAAFGTQAGFSKSLLKDMSSGAEERTLAKLFCWSRNLKWPAGDNGGLWISTAKDVEDCHNQTDLFTSAGLWPFVKAIR